MSSGSKKVALVTGAARGIGLAAATRFLEDGWHVAVLDILGEAGGSGRRLRGTGYEMQDNGFEFEAFEISNLRSEISDSIQARSPPAREPEGTKALPPTAELEES